MESQAQYAGVAEIAGQERPVFQNLYNQKLLQPGNGITTKENKYSNHLVRTLLDLLVAVGAE